MGRREQREQIFKLLFRVEFNELEEMPQQRDLFLDEIMLPVEEDGLAAREKDLSYIAEKYGGQAKFTTSKNSFSVDIVLPLSCGKDDGGKDI